MRNAWWLGQTNDFSPFMVGIILLVCWSAIWNGLSLWHAAKRNESGWFIFFLIVHTAGILELYYLFFVVRIGQSSNVKKRLKRTR